MWIENKESDKLKSFACNEIHLEMKMSFDFRYSKNL